MKTKRTLSPTALSLLVGITILSFIGCTNQQGNANDSKTKVSTSQPNSPTPKMDIHTAAYLGDLEIIKQHIKEGTDLNTIEPMGGSTPLISATVFGKTDVALELIKAGADLDIQNNEGSTALHSAAFFCRMEIVKSLLEHGANKSLINKSGASAIDTVTPEFDKVKGIYDFFCCQLGPLGLKLDYTYIENARPQIAQLLK